jgi:hypothetical protein
MTIYLAVPSKLREQRILRAATSGDIEPPPGASFAGNCGVAAHDAADTAHFENTATMSSFWRTT